MKIERTHVGLRSNVCIVYQEIAHLRELREGLEYILVWYLVDLGILAWKISLAHHIDYI